MQASRDRTPRAASSPTSPKPAGPPRAPARRSSGATWAPTPSLTAWPAAIAGGFTPEELRSPEQHDAVALAHTLADELRQADGAILALPLYNWGVSQHVKTWIDLAVAGGGNGERLLDGKPAVVLTTRGGGYGPGTPREGWDHNTAYLRRIVADVWGADLILVERELTLAGVKPGHGRPRRDGCSPEEGGAGGRLRSRQPRGLGGGCVVAERRRRGVGAASPEAAGVTRRCDAAAMTTYSRTTQFEGATFIRASFKGATLRFSDVSGVTMRAMDVNRLDIDSHDLFFGTLLVNGVDVVPLVDAELTLRFPGRELQKAQTPEGLRDGWAAVRAAWATTVAATPHDLVDATLRTNGRSPRPCATSCSRPTRGCAAGSCASSSRSTRSARSSPAPRRRVSTRRSSARTCRRTTRCSASRAERQRMVTDFLAGVTPELLAEERGDPWGSKRVAPVGG